jgi:hypothetical protein
VVLWVQPWCCRCSIRLGGPSKVPWGAAVFQWPTRSSGSGRCRSCTVWIVYTRSISSLLFTCPIAVPSSRGSTRICCWSSPLRCLGCLTLVFLSFFIEDVHFLNLKSNLFIITSKLIFLLTLRLWAFIKKLFFGISFYKRHTSVM